VLLSNEASRWIDIIDLYRSPSAGDGVLKVSRRLTEIPFHLGEWQHFIALLSNEALGRIQVVNLDPPFNPAGNQKAT